MADQGSQEHRQRKTALVLSGGGARGAYEAGVIAYLEQELAPELQRELKFDILAGTSIGALNACSLAALADNPVGRCSRITNTWHQLDCDSVLSFGFLDAFRLLRESLGSHSVIRERHDERKAGLIDTKGLQKILLEQIPWRRIHWNLQRGCFSALTVAATNVGTGRTTVFLQRREPGLAEWGEEASYETVPARISARHALASAAIPLIFPPVRIGHALFADGGLRLNVPLSPALRLGAERLIVISLRAPGVVRGDVTRARSEEAFPSAAFLLGKMLNAIMEENVEQDLDRLRRLNGLLEAGSQAYGNDFSATLNRALQPLGHTPMRQVRTILIRPSEDLGALAARYMRERFKPGHGMASRLLMSIAERESAEEADFTAYLLFDGGFADWLIDLGRRDARARHDEWVRFWAESAQSEWERTYAS